MASSSPGNGSLMDRLMALPKWALILIGAVLVGILGFCIFWFGFGLGDKQVEEIPQHIVVDMPDGDVDNPAGSRLEAFAQQKMNGGASAYWESLAGDQMADDFDSRYDSGEGGVSNSGNKGLNFDIPVSAGEDDYLDPAEYSELERTLIRTGGKTKAAIDLEHAEKRERERRQAEEDAHRRTTEPKPLTQAQQDSLYFARMDKAYQMAMRYSNPAGTASEPAAQAASAAAAQQETPPEPVEEEPRRIDFGEGGAPTGVIATTLGGGDDIITSLSEDVPAGMSASRAKPVKATFLKDEKLLSGNRVIIRLMQDLPLTDGTVIPANTHITGTCSIGRRLKIDVKVLQYGGKLYPVDVSVYDNDGMEGIYCPLVEGDKTKKTLKEIGKGALSTVASVGASLVGGTDIMTSMMLRNALQNGTSAFSVIDSDGTVSVNVSSGYEFFVYENIKDKK